MQTILYIGGIFIGLVVTVWVLSGPQGRNRGNHANPSSIRPIVTIVTVIGVLAGLVALVMWYRGKL